MRYIKLGSTDIKVSVVGLGTFVMGGWSWGGCEKKDALRAIKSSIDGGINFLDTAPIYGNGFSEELTGEAIKGIRDKIIIATKCGLVFNTEKGEYFFDYEIGRNVQRYLGPESIRKELELSLKRLNTEYIDLYQTHWQESTTPISSTMAALLNLKKEGKIRAIGVSNVNLDQLKEYTTHGVIDSDQEKYSLLDREIEAEILPFCEDNNITMLAYSPIARGLLTGKVDENYKFNNDDYRKTASRFSTENRKKVIKMLKEMNDISKNHNIGYAQLAIAWTVCKSKNNISLVGARNEKQAIANLIAGDVVLSPKEIKAIDDIVENYNISK
jgi:methylglyoxal reductase